jgi:hypothetical protein
MRGKLFFFFFCIQSLFAQSSLKGKLISDGGSVEGILVVNKSTKQNTTTNSLGEFEILAQPNDVLIVASKNSDGLEIKLNDNSFRQNPLKITITIKINQLEEVKVENISTKALGIVSKNVKEYTPAERKLRTAGKLKWYSPLLIPLGGMSVDGVLNAMSGRTKMLKKELVIEKYETVYKKLMVMFPEDFYSTSLQIPQEYINGFLFSVSENKEIIAYVNANNTNLIRFKLIDLAVIYKQANAIK